jgi:hypothetical protein
MKTYEIELRRTSFVTLTIEAEDQDAAEALAWEQIQRDYYRDDGDWEIGFVDEVNDIATDETRSFGPQGAAA